jgi:hypothetical protein
LLAMICILVTSSSHELALASCLPRIRSAV